MNLKNWLNHAIKQNLLHAFKRVMFISLPILAVIIFYVTESKVKNIIENNKYSIILGLKTGDKTLISKSLSLLSQTTQVIDFELTDQNNNIILKNDEKNIHSSNMYKLKFTTNLNLLDDQFVNWGFVRMTWSYEFDLLFLIILTTVFVFLATNYLIQINLNVLTQKLVANFSSLSTQVEQEKPLDLFSSVNELQTLYAELVKSKHSILENELNKNKLQNKEILFNLSQKLAHDIRSPISTLNLISSKIENAEIKSLQLAVVEQINAIANALLNENKTNTQGSGLHLIPNSINNREKQSLKSIFKNLKNEYAFKKISIQQDIIFDINEAQINDSRISAELGTIIYRSVNNFIQNAIEASPPPNSTIIVRCIKLNADKNMFEISVIDEGKGIPADIIKRLGNEVISYGKDNEAVLAHNSGSGIALYNAKIDIHKHGGELLIESQIGTGTQVSIRICAEQ